MKYFFDTEFIDYIQPVPISLGIVSEDDREYYAEFAKVDWSLDFDGWHAENTRPHLLGQSKTAILIAREVEEFVRNDHDPEFWGYVCAYDWVVLCGLFGRMIDRPATWPSYANDLKPWANRLGVTHKPVPEGATHNSLADARGNRAFHGLLLSTGQGIGHPHGGGEGINQTR